MSNLPCSRAPLKVLSTPFVVDLVRPYAASEKKEKASTLSVVWLYGLSIFIVGFGRTALWDPAR